MPVCANLCECCLQQDFGHLLQHDENENWNLTNLRLEWMHQTLRLDRDPLLILGKHTSCFFGAACMAFSEHARDNDNFTRARLP